MNRISHLERLLKFCVWSQIGNPVRNWPYGVNLFISGVIRKKLVPTIWTHIFTNLSGSLTSSAQTVSVSSSSNVSVKRTCSKSSISPLITSILSSAFSPDLNSKLSLAAYCRNPKLYLSWNPVAVSSSWLICLFSRHFCYIFLMISTICLSTVEQTRMRSSALSIFANQIWQLGISFYPLFLPLPWPFSLSL